MFPAFFLNLKEKKHFPSHIKKYESVLLKVSCVLSTSWGTQKSGSIWGNETKLHPGADQSHPHEGERPGGQLTAILPPHQVNGRHARCRRRHTPQSYFSPAVFEIHTQIWNLSCVTDSEEDQPVLSEHLHPGRLHESGVSRDDVRGHCLPASQGPGRHGETPPIPQVAVTAETPPFRQDWLDYWPDIYWMLNCVCFCYQNICKNVYLLLK